MEATEKRTPTDIGKRAEDQAAGYLEKRGMKLLSRNYRCRNGELDLVMQDRDVLVFVEVRYRANARFGSAAESVDLHKQRRLAAAANHYLQCHSATNRPCRFDVVAITESKGENVVEWLRNAIEFT